MKLERIDQDQNAGYPTLTSHQNNRNAVIKTAMGGLALAALAGGCCQNTIDQDTPAMRGEMPAVVQPPCPQKLGGEPKAPAPPPDIIPEEEHPVLMGIMVAPTPPAEEDEK